MKTTYRTLINLLAVLSTAYATVDPTTSCPRNLPSTSLMAVYGDLCYQFVSTEKYWTQARDYCLQYGGRLVKIDNPGVNSFLLKTLSKLWWTNNGIWIGLNDLREEYVWEWTGYSADKNEPASWTYWGSGHPNTFFHSRKDCAIMERNRGEWTWSETYCYSAGYTYRYICQYRAKLPTTAVKITTTNAVPETSSTETITVLQYTSDELYPTTEGGLHLAPIPAEIRSLKEEGSNVNLWLIIAGCSVFCIMGIICATLAIRYRRVKKQQELSFETLARVSLLSQPTPVSQTPGYMNRPSCPLPSPPQSEFCAPNPYCGKSTEENRSPRAESNIYLNSASVSAAYCPMNQSTSSIDKLPPAPAIPRSAVTYATPARPQSAAYSLADEYLCPSEISGSDVMCRDDVTKRHADAMSRRDVSGDDDVIGKHNVTGGDEKGIQDTYDQPKAGNVYSEIPEALYNNIYEAL